MKICISIGDYNGIGAEVILKTLRSHSFKDHKIIILSNPEIISYYQHNLDMRMDFKEIGSASEAHDEGFYILNPDESLVEIDPGKLSESAGLHAMKAIEKGIELCMNGSCDALVTAPISKDAVNQAGYSIPGHTEFLQEKTGSDDVLMMLVNEGLRVSLLSTHIPLKEVAAQVSKERIHHKAKLLHDSLINDFGIDEPRIAVFGLNPHAGDGGLLGDEELNIIEPAIVELQVQVINAQGPFPADGFFGSDMQDHFDGILAMYHDQGLAPFKALSFGNGVNFTAGLPIIRTSPDHGTAFGIAGENKADPSSFNAALELAIELAEKRAHG